MFNLISKNHWYIRAKLSDEMMGDVKYNISLLEQTKDNEANHLLAGKIDKEYFIEIPISVKEFIFDMIKEYKQGSRLKFLSSSRAKTTTALLRKQMDILLNTVSATKQNWVICINPSSKCTSEFEDHIVLDQIIGRGLVSLLSITQKGND